MRRFVSAMAILITCALLAVGGVSAGWTYALNHVDQTSSTAGIGLSEFEFAPEEILPDDGTGDHAGENHLMLIDNVVNHVTYGLNSNKKPIIKNLLLDGEALVYSQQNVQGGNLKHLLLSGAQVNRLDFVVQRVSDTEFSCYTFQSNMLTSSYYDQPILVFKTKIVYENGKWDATVSYEGEAPVTRVSVKNSTFYSVNVNEWVRT
jgi:hypothetical protein